VCNPYRLLINLCIYVINELFKMMVRVFTIAIYVFLLLLAAPTVLANGGAAAEEGFAHGFEHMGIGGWIIIPILFMILMMVFMRGGPMRGMMMGHGSHNKDNQKNNKTALDVLKERYAKGEIDKKEFEEKKKDLI